jgi:UDPglucose--hexose-1-phosphate uridylyltransferase
MNELRWNAVLSQWVVVSTHRQERPQMPAAWCPFCPGSGKVPDHYDVYLFPNDFPAFSQDAPPYQPYAPEAGLFASTGARGVCDVVLYSSNHKLPPSKLTLDGWGKVVQLWAQRTRELAAIDDVSTIAVFENCGEAIGVTMPHPHGQIYAMPFISPMVQAELRSSHGYAAGHGGACVFCDLLRGELDQQERIVFANKSMVVFVPYAARFPSEVAIYPRRHVSSLLGLHDDERTDLAEAISVARRKLDNLYGFLMPLMMSVRQKPFRNTGDAPDAPYHLRVEMLPVQRSATKLKYLATIETAYGTFLADTRPEEKAAELRKAEPATPAEALA